MAEIIKKCEPFIVIICCTDGRGDPRKVFGPKDNEAVVQANCGGRVTNDVLRTLHVLDALSNEGVGTVIVAHHTDCGMMNATDDDLRARMKRKWPEKAGKTEGIRFEAFAKDLRQNVRGEMAVVKGDPYSGKREGAGGAWLGGLTGTGEEK
ncbi:hypothetical protein OEA41_004085 [Lepraria neglecta]|uniref:Carbonic anhydrase n=1 Tax=Lepraria neglecta TaxID=209136 RepID=A0AAE0DJK3_9LECA|nr:hypothetical protein OEA41_004085 [Lepraria neglecta]